MKAQYVMLALAAFAIPVNAGDLLNVSCEGKSEVTISGRIDGVTTKGKPPVSGDVPAAAPAQSGSLLQSLGYAEKPGSDMPPTTVGEANGPGAASPAKPVKTGNGPAEVSVDNLDKPHKALAGQDLTQWNQYCAGRDASEVGEWRKKKCTALDADFK